MKVVSPATTSVLKFVPRSENLKKVPKVEVSPLAYAQAQYSSSRLQVSGIKFFSERAGTPSSTAIRMRKEKIIRDRLALQTILPVA
jgi:hypothetical protein